MHKTTVGRGPGLTFRWLGLAALLALLALLALAGCGGGGEAPQPEASTSDLALGAATAGATPFIALMPLRGASLALVSAVTYTVQPRPGTASKAVNVTYSIAALQNRGDVQPSVVTVPVFGLYAGWLNQGTVTVTFTDGSTQSLPFGIQTAPYTDPAGIFGQPQILKARATGSPLGFDFFAMKTVTGPTVVVDTDGMIRWVSTGYASMSVAYDHAGFTIGSNGGPQMQRVELDGTVTTSTIGDPSVTGFTHNIDIGKAGLLADVNTADNVDSTLEQFDATGQVTAGWDLAGLLAAYMRSQGDDPGAFVRPGTDWFHLNSATYDARDDSVVVSSRENFVMKIDYATGQPIWILGDPTKYWHTFASLRAKALTLAPGGLVPIGQHAVSITSDGLLMLFNDGAASSNMPAGAPAGASRSYSAVSAYTIDAAAMTATETWRFDYGQSIASYFCSSAYDAGDGSVLIDYALAAGGTTARLVGLDPNHQVVFDFSYPNDPAACSTSWNAVPVPLGNLQILQ
ncbi:MAG: aryl-sulfate sulfotransferase [Burkholderiales bacterium]|nr:aryl-sulfate sulfotransferase [Burkholderiales bacterium]